MAVVKKSRFCGPGCERRENLPIQQSVESESEGEGSEEDEENDTHSDDSSLSDNQLEVEVITNTDDFLFDFPDIV